MEPVDDLEQRYPRIARALADPILKGEGGPIDRSRTTGRVVKMCVEERLSLAQTRWVVNSDPELAARVEEQFARSRPRDDVLECFSNARSNGSKSHEQESWGPATDTTGHEDRSNVKQSKRRRDRDVAHTDKGNAIFLVEQYRDGLRFVPEINKWIIWTGLQWRTAADSGAVDTAAGQIAMDLPTKSDEDVAHKMRSLSSSGIIGMVRLARSDPGMRVRRDKLDANGYELNTPSGIVDLRTGRLIDHRRDAWHTKLTGAAYDSDADCPQWKVFLDTTFGGNQALIDYVQNLLGCATIGKVLYHILPFCFGSGQNGKTVLLDVALKAMGDYAITAPPTFLLSTHRNHDADAVKFIGARLVACSEVNQGAHLDEAKVKQYTGGDLLHARYLYTSQGFDFVPTHTLFLVGNHQPAVNAGGDSFWRRLRLIPFEHRVSDDERIEDLQGRLFESEGPAILAWMVRGAVSVLSDGLTDPTTVKDATEEYAESEDHLQHFIEECVVKVTEVYKVPAGDVYREYQEWCRDNGIRPKDSRWFGRDMATHGFRSAKSNGKRIFEGLMLLGAPNTHDPRNPE